MIDVLIVGAGPVGAALALLLQESGLAVQLLEARAGAAQDGRTLALSHGSRVILERAGAWSDALPVTPIDAIHVSHKGAFGRALLTARDADVPALGYVLGYAGLQAALDERMAALGIAVERGARVTGITTASDSIRVGFQQDGVEREFESALLVLADGGANVAKIPGIEIVEKDYGQTALVGAVTSDQPHRGIAYERFTPMGPAALLPKGNDFSLVWTAAPDEVGRLLALDDDAFLAELNAHFGQRAGRFLSIGKRGSFPLKLKHAKPRVAERVAVIGAAAQALHPVAGQGFNLGVRDAADLARLLIDAGGGVANADAGGAALLSRFAALRQGDARMGIRFTDVLVGLFSTENPLLTAGRGVGLAMLDMLPPARRLLAQKMIYGA